MSVSIQHVPLVVAITSKSCGVVSVPCLGNLGILFKVASSWINRLVTATDLAVLAAVHKDWVGYNATFQWRRLGVDFHQCLRACSQPGMRTESTWISIFWIPTIGRDSTVCLRSLAFHLTTSVHWTFFLAVLRCSSYKSSTDWGSSFRPSGVPSKVSAYRQIMVRRTL